MKKRKYSAQYARLLSTLMLTSPLSYAADTVNFNLGGSIIYPERPSINRTVHEYEQATVPAAYSTFSSVRTEYVRYTRPHIPAHRTSADGRVGLSIKPLGDSLNFYLFTPEKVDAVAAIPHFMDGPKKSDGTPDLDSNSSFMMADHLGETEVANNNPLAFIIKLSDQFFDKIQVVDVYSDNSYTNKIETSLVGVIKQFGLLDDPAKNNPRTFYQKSTTTKIKVGHHDVYELVVVASTDFAPASGTDNYRFTLLQFTPIFVYVENPKTPQAKITQIIVDTANIKSTTVDQVEPQNRSVVIKGKSVSRRVSKIPNDNPSAAGAVPIDNLLDPSFTADGKVMITRSESTFNHKWKDEAGNQHTNKFARLLYAFTDGHVTRTTTDEQIRKFGNLMPLSYATSDSRINTTYPFAMQAFRDPQGNSILPRNVQPGIDGVTVDKYLDMQGNYGWIDSGGRNFFFTTISPSLNKPDKKKSTNYISRYSNTPAFPVDASTTVLEADDHTQGIVVMGAWTQGKMVMIDNSINNIDYGIPPLNRNQRVVSLYSPDGADTGTILVGGGRGNDGKPLGSVSVNSSHFESNENKFFFSDKFKPTLPQDVVWYLTSGRSTAQFAFDDYVDLNSYILSNMSGASNLVPYDSLPDITKTGPTVEVGKSPMQYHDGYEWVLGTGTNPTGSWVFNPANVKFANAGTTKNWNVPAYATTFGTVRVEPVANGGIEGRGAWLNGQSGLNYAIPPQNAAVTDWYMGVFVDSRFSDDLTVRELIKLPDNSTISLVGRKDIRYSNLPGGQPDYQFPLPQVLPQKGWAHLGFQILVGGKVIEFYHNGMLYDIKQFTSAVFQMSNGNLKVGAASNGFRGWVDDFKVFARSFDPEVCANQARGTLVGFAVGANTALENRASLYNRSTVNGASEINTKLRHYGQQTYARYAVHYDYTTELGAHLMNRPSGTESIRDSLLFPENPLFHDAHRPDSSNTEFCFGCHVNTSTTPGLKMAALDLHNTTLAKDDIRRQPSQSPAKVFGIIPPNWLNTTTPGTTVTKLASDGSTVPITTSGLNPTGTYIDEYKLASENPAQRTPRTLTLVDLTLDIPIMEITDQAVIDYNDPVIAAFVAVFGTTEFGVRANLDAGQGAVTFTSTVGFSSSQYHANEAPYTMPLSQSKLNANNNRTFGTINIQTFQTSNSSGAPSGVMGGSLRIASPEFVGFPNL